MKPNKRDEKTCKFFLKGICSYGDNCYFFHPPTLRKMIKATDFEVKIDQKNFKYEQKEVDRFNIKLNIPFSIQDNNQELLLIRHGLSVYNFASSQFFFETGTSFRDEGAKAYQLNPDLIDSDLHPYGILMCENNAKYLKDIEFEAVFVSPLGRALQTADLMFKNHPKRNEIKFIVMPELTEILSKVQDISDIEKQIEKFEKDFDFSMMKEAYKENIDAWQILNLSNEKMKQELFDAYQQRKAQLINDNKATENDEESSPTESSNKKTTVGPVQQFLLGIMNNTFPSAIEKVADTLKRATLVRQKICNYHLDHSINPLKKKICIISHNAFFQSFTSKGVTETGYVLRGQPMENCEIKGESLFQYD